MCHHLLPDGPPEDERASRFANVAVPRLIDEMLALGSDESDLVARLFGGARVLKAFTGSAALLGARNVEAAIELLARRRIRRGAGDTGGTRGRKLRFSTWNGSCSVTEL
jgi:chemotaxis protein CheD